MAEEGRSKRQKSSKDGAVIIAQRERIAELESDNEQLRRRVQQLESNHEALPVSSLTVVDLSRIDASIVTQISSFLDAPRELLNLALTCKSFGWRQPTSTLSMSLVEDVARQAVRSSATDAAMSFLPQYAGGTTTWLSILHRFDNLLSFDVLLGDREGIEYQDGDRATVHGPGDISCAAVSSIYAMRSGVHYVEFKIIFGTPNIGIVRPMPNLDADAYAGESFDWFNDELYPGFLAEQSDEWGNGNVHACEYWSYSGRMNWTNWDGEGKDAVNWEGMEGCGTGDTVGMLLDLDEGTLTLFKNNRHLGVAKDGLSGSYCWYVAGLWGGDEVTMKRGEHPRAG